MLTLTAAATAQQSDSGATRPAPKDTSSTSDADKWGTIPARWTFAAGGYLPNIATSMTLSSALLPATEIDLEKQLGLKPTTQTIDLYAAYRFSKKNVLSLEFFDVSRTGSHTLGDSVIVNDTAT
jgi:hypothetical protein